jgi:hypothetical protein
MASYVKFELEDGTVVYVESTDTPKGSSGLIPGGRGDHITDQPAVSFDEAVLSIRKMSTSLVQNLLSGFEERPEEVGISFGIKASGEIGSLVVARGGMEANYNVSLRWRHNDKDKDKEKEDKKDEKKEEEKKTEAEA